MSDYLGPESFGSRTQLTTSRGTFEEADDSKKMQTVRLRALHGEAIKDVEHWQPYGFNVVPVKPKQGENEQPEIVMQYMGSNRSHPVATLIADRRYRPKNWQEGETGVYDHQGQLFHHQKDASVHQSPKKTITRLVDSNGTEVATITQETSKTTIKRGNSTTTIEGDKVTHDVSGTKVVLRQNRVDLGAENAPNAVMTSAGASTKVFSVV
jgi:phage gp45-like